MQDDIARFIALVRRELGAEVVQLVDAPDAADVSDGSDGTPPGDAFELRAAVPGGRLIVARFSATPAERDVKQRRLDMLASTFDLVLDEPTHSRRVRPPLVRSLQDELAGLSARAVAINALVIDANSPIVWGASKPAGLVAPPVAGSGPVLGAAKAENDGTAEGPAQGDAAGDAATTALSRRAIAAVRQLPEIGSLHKGRHVRHVDRSGDPPLVAHSFAGIYLVVVAFDASFDELRAERAVLESLPRIERLVLAIPPLEPPPDIGAGAVAIRRPRRG